LTTFIHGVAPKAFVDVEREPSNNVTKIEEAGALPRTHGTTSGKWEV